MKYLATEAYLSGGHVELARPSIYDTVMDYLLSYEFDSLPTGEELTYMDPEKIIDILEEEMDEMFCGDSNQLCELWKLNHKFEIITQIDPRDNVDMAEFAEAYVMAYGSD